MIKKNVIGIDITDTSLRLIQLDGGAGIAAHSTLSLSAGVIVGGIVQNEERFMDACRQLLADAKPEPIRSDFTKPVAFVALPEILFWSHTTKVPSDTPADNIVGYAIDEATKLFPIDMPRAYTTCYTTEVHGTQFATTLSAEKTTIDAYMSCFIKLGLEVVFVGSRFYSMARAVLPRVFEDNDYLMVHIGADTALIGAFDEHAIAHMVVRTRLGHSPDTPKESADAQQFDSSYIAHSIANDIHEIMRTFHDATGQHVSHTLLLCGFDGTCDAELMQMLEKETNCTVSVGNVYQHTKTGEVLGDAASLFASAIGLGLLSRERSLPHINILEAQQEYAQRAHTPQALLRMVFRKKAVAASVFYVHARVRALYKKLRQQPLRTRAIVLLFVCSLFFLGLVLLFYAL